MKSAARVPAALAKRAAAAGSAKLARLAREAKADIALIQRRRAEIAEAFYDIGEALVRLKRREVVLALGCKTFAELCTKHVGMSASQADRLIDIVENMPRDEAIAVGATKAASLVALARATPADDTPSGLLAGGVRVRGKKVDLRHASSRAIARATAEVRESAPPRGHSVTKSERARVEALAHALSKAGAVDARVMVKAGKTGAGARVVIDVAIADLPLLERALRR